MARGAVTAGFLMLLALTLGPSGLLTGPARAAETGAPAINLVPWPLAVESRPGSMPLKAGTRIVAGSAALLPLAKVLAEEIRQTAGLQLPAVQGRARAGDLALELDPQLRGEDYEVTITAGRATVRGGTYGAVALGSVTLLQALTRAGTQFTLPCLAIRDRPQADYRGLLLDVARQYHSIAQLKQIIQLCRLYKARYLQLHLTDDPSFMFPSRAYPQLNTQNQHGGKSYTLEELKDLVAYADARNVTIIPEYEVPGHSAAAIRALRELFIIKDTKPYEHHASINFCKDEVLKVVATVVGEMCAVFQSTPYFHIGGDEADLALADQNVDFKAAMQKYNLPNQHELYRRFVVQMNDIVRQHHKQMIVWEGFGRGGQVKIPNDIVVMAYEIRFYQPNDLVRDGYQVVNASWTPLYVVNARARPPEEILAWNMFQFKPFDAKPTDPGTIVAPTPLVIGAQMCAWEQAGAVELPSLRNRLPAMMERLWNPGASQDYNRFAARQKVTDRLLDLLLGP